MASASNPQSLFNVFVYGSLLAEEVVRALLKRVPPSSPAILHNFHRFSIKGCVYPAILPVENKKVNGKVLSGITIPELDILDKFEDVEYERKTVDVSLTDSSNTLTVEAYIWADQSATNLYGEWDFEDPVKASPRTHMKLPRKEWERSHKQSFLKMTMEFLEELEQPDQSGSI